MHGSVRQFVSRMAQQFDLGACQRVLELGSYDVNGSVRDLLPATTYLGVDMREGPGVDLVLPPGAVLPELGTWDLVVSTEMLEHDERPWVSFARMASALTEGGFVLVTTRGFECGRHDYPADYWRFSQSSMRILYEDVGLSVLHMEDDTELPGVFAIGVR